MEWYIILLLFILIILAVVLGVILACMLIGKRCTLSIQQRQPNHELTQIQQEQERKKQKKFSSKLKRTFHSSSKTEQPIAPVEDVKTVEFTFKLGDRQKESEEINTNNEAAMGLLHKPGLSKAKLDARQKTRDEIRKKYNI